MTQNEKKNIQRRLNRHTFMGQNEFFILFLKSSAVLLYLIGAVWGWRKQTAISSYAETIALLSPIMKAGMTHAFPVYLLLGGAVLIYLLLYPFGRRVAKGQLQSIGLTNHAGMVPELLRKKRDKAHPRVTIWEFRNQSIPLAEWEDNRAAIEAALDISVIKMTYGKGKSRVLVYAVPALIDLPEILCWKDKYLSPESFVLVLGESLLGPVTVNLAHSPHILLGGSTGSGKSVLLKLLLMQAMKKGARVYIADFKGGVDFPPLWNRDCRICFEETDLLDLLTGLVAELERRKEIFRTAGCSSIDTYNKSTGENLQRIIFACDEVAEVLDKTGADAERKKLLAQIENRLSTIARQGRAFGIHLILATQRPDASIIPGQIRNNMDFRVCGRADSVLSSIILDNTDAADLIPKDARGRFLLHDGTIFQAYWFEESDL